MSQQANNGSFPAKGKLFDTSLPGESAEGLALTAYVSLALVEANADPDIRTNGRFSTSINIALDYLSRGLEGLDDPYAVSLVTYVLHLANHPLKDGAFNLLETLATSSRTGNF